MTYNITIGYFFFALLTLFSCKIDKTINTPISKIKVEGKFKDKPLVTEIYTADPSAHLFNNKIYIYASHDVETGISNDNNGGHYDMKDYHVLSMDSINGKVRIHDVGLSINDISWAKSKLWAPDAAYKNNKYYLYFPVKDQNEIFKIGVAVSNKPEGPFKAEPNPIEGSYSIDPTVFTDTDGTSYMYFGGISGGQLHQWNNGKFNDKISLNDLIKENATASLPRVVRMSTDMLNFDEDVKEIQLIDKNGNSILASDNQRRFFEGAWIHKNNGVYYFSYSTGDTHLIVYATGDNPYGPFTYQGVLNNPVQGWTNHHSVIEIEKKWYLFYHDTELSNVDYLRNVKVTELIHNKDGSIQPIHSILKN